jgi:hypothetical protein
MQKSFSTSSVDYKHYNRSLGSPSRSIPIRVISNPNNNYYSSDTNSHHQTYLQRTSSTSSFCSSSSTSSANYRILPVRYSSVDRIIEKPAIITPNKHGINVRIRFQRPNHHHQRDRHQHIEEYERYHKRHTTNEHQHYESCPVLNRSFRYTKPMSSNFRRPSNINYIETRSIVRGYSSDQLNHNNTHSTTLVIRQRSLPPPSIKIPRVTHTKIKHIPLDTRSMFTPIITRVIQEEQEE